MLRTTIQNNLKIRKIIYHLLNLLIICVNSTTNYSFSKIVYDLNPLTHLDLSFLSIDEITSLDSNIKEQILKALHENVRHHIHNKIK